MTKELKNKEEQYNVFLNYTDSKKERHSKAGKVLVGLLVICILICISVFIFVVFNSNKLTEKQDEASFLSIFFNKNKQNFSMPFMAKRQNVLLLGVDSNGRNSDPFKGTRSDTMILLSVDPSDKTVNAISIPRDSKVYLANDFGVQKINSAHALGGIELVKKTVQDTLGIKVDKYIIVNNEGVRKIVDTLGGIPIYVEKNLYYNDYSGGLHVNLTKGIHVLNGEEAEGYLRYRKDGLGDIGRTSRQQWFLRGFMEKAQSPSTITKIPDVLKIASAYIKTDMSLYEMSHFAALARSIDMENVEVATLPGGPSKKGYISYWILDPEKTQEVIDRLVYRHKTAPYDKKLIAGIMYTSAKEETAMRIKSKLEQMGYEVNCVGRAQLPHSQFIGHNSAVSSDFVSWLKKKLPEIRSTQFVYDPVRMYCVKSDFTIVVADN